MYFVHAYYIASKYDIPNVIQLLLLTLQYPLMTLKIHPPPEVRLRAQQSPEKSLSAIMSSHETVESADSALSAVSVP